ncbi:MAG: CBS domain-containing protein [Thermodesulfobacteriota bacterium]|nr:CBS domain-containing protein [Thermodesulfobacteriota bacterium]
MADEKMVKDIMFSIDQYPFVYENQTVAEAVSRLEAFTCAKGHIQFSDLVVFNDKEQLAGKVTVFDIVKSMEPRLFQKSGTEKFEGLKSDLKTLAILWADHFYKDCQNRFNKQIKELMTPIDKIPTLQSTDTLLEAFYVMIQTNTSTLPVLEGENFVGVISIGEMFVALMNRCEI